MQGNGAAAAAQTSRTIKIRGKTIELGKLTFKDFATAKEEACAEYKRSLIQTYTKNLDLVPAAQQGTIIQDAFEKAEKITADSLPMKKAWLPKRNQDGKILLNKGERFYDPNAKQWINAGTPLLEEQDIDYSGWWLSQTTSGRMFAIWLSMRRCPSQENMTLDDLAALVQEDDEGLAEAANAVGELAQQRLGNSRPLAEVAGADK